MFFQLATRRSASQFGQSGRTFLTSRPLFDTSLNFESEDKDSDASEKIPDKWEPDVLMKEMLKISVANKERRANQKMDANELESMIINPETKAKIDYAKILWRKRFMPGESYEPRDLIESTSSPHSKQFSSTNSAVNNRNRTGKTDFFKDIESTPEAEYKNYKLLSEFVNDIGQVLPRHMTGLERRTQLKLTRVINRAVAFGIIPKTRKHPETVNLK